MTWCNDCSDVQTIETSSQSPPSDHSHHKASSTCPSCGHQIKGRDQAGIHDLPGLPAGVKFDPTDQELLEHLEGKVRSDACKLHHPLIDEFIPTIDGENGICYTHPEKLPGVGKDGLVRHFFHRPSKAYTTGTRKRRKVHTDAGGDPRWHKTGKTRPVFINGKLKGYKKILVLYTNYGKLRKPEKTNWVMHQYHLGNNEDEKDGELVVSKVFYQTQPRQCGSAKDSLPTKFKVQSGNEGSNHVKNNGVVELYNPSFISFEQDGQTGANSSQLLPQFAVHDGSFIPK